jgi:hypothetical protein
MKDKETTPGPTFALSTGEAVAINAGFCPVIRSISVANQSAVLTFFAWVIA